MHDLDCMKEPEEHQYIICVGGRGQGHTNELMVEKLSGDLENAGFNFDEEQISAFYEAFRRMSEIMMASAEEVMMAFKAIEDALQPEMDSTVDVIKELYGEVAKQTDVYYDEMKVKYDRFIDMRKEVYFKNQFRNVQLPRTFKIPNIPRRLL